MDKNKLARRTRNLFGLWCVLYALFEVASSIYVSYQQTVNGINPTLFLSSFQLAMLLIVSLIFVPSLIGIYYLASKGSSHKLKKAIFWLLLILSIWAVAMILCTIAELFMPGFLT